LHTNLQTVGIAHELTDRGIAHELTDWCPLVVSLGY